MAWDRFGTFYTNKIFEIEDIRIDARIEKYSKAKFLFEEFKSFTEIIQHYRCFEVGEEEEEEDNNSVAWADDILRITVPRNMSEIYDEKSRILHEIMHRGPYFDILEIVYKYICKDDKIINTTIIGFMKELDPMYKYTIVVQLYYDGKILEFVDRYKKLFD